jgi:predicted Holliday junction resolvase-like endonuclease
MLPFLHALAYGCWHYHAPSAHRYGAFPHVKDWQTDGRKEGTDKFPDAKREAVKRSRSVLSGIFAEQFAPYLPDFPFSPTEAKFIGAPIDFLVFKGIDAQHIDEVIFVEVKSGSARMNSNEAQPQRGNRK